MDRLNQLPCALLVTDSTGQIVEINHELLALVGHTASQWRGHAMAGLSNRRALDTAVNHWRAQSPPEACAALLMVDVDHFKAVNDLHGHGEGDKVLRALADQLHSSMRSSDLAVRYGGEEFVMWLPLAARTGAGHAAQRVHDNVRQVQVAGKSITVSIGVATARNTPGTDLLQDLTHQADKAVYEAKASGRTRPTTLIRPNQACL